MPEPVPTSAMQRLVQRLSRLPGVGKRSAERIVFYLLRQDAEESELLAAAIADLKRSTRPCSVCGTIAEMDPCPVCADPRRDHGQVLVVEQPTDVVTFETMGQFTGVYHVLMGRLAPLEGVGPGELNIASLLQRVQQPVHDEQRGIDRTVREVIVGTNPTLEGDGTALYLSKQLGKLGVNVTRLARGLPSGMAVQRLSKAVLADAIAGRQPM